MVVGWSSAQESATYRYVPPMAMTTRDVPLYPMPDAQTASLQLLPIRTAVFIDGRDDRAEWVLVRLIDESARGWLRVDDMLFSADVVIPSLIIMNTTSAQADPLTRLQAIPVLYNMNTPQVQAIFARGQSSGARANVFVKVGDSNTRSGAFLHPFGMGARGNCTLGVYSSLQPTIDFFSVSPRPPYPNSFDSRSLAVQDGLGTPGLFDPMRATDSACIANESPLACEYRLSKPSVSVIMIGMMDLKSRALDAYRTNLERIMQLSVDQGVIPVLTTYPVLPDAINPAAPMWDAHLEMNGIMIDAAERFGTPLINLWAALRTVPDYGIGPDRSHLKQQIGGYCDFTGVEQQVGGTMRNLVTLQALDVLRREVLE
jgi:hypothetical protein